MTALQPDPFQRPPATDLGNWREAPFSRWSFHHVQDLIPCATIAGAKTCRPLPEGPVPDLAGHALEVGGDLGSLLNRSFTDSMVVLHRGRKVWQWQADHCDISRPHIVFSVSKSITAMLTGIVADLGVIDVRKPVSHYLPDTRHSGYGDCTIQHVLDMTVALKFTEEYLNPDGDYYRYRNATCWNPVDQTAGQESLESFLYTLGKADFEHGEIFNYKSPNSDLLGLLLERATDTYYADLLSQLLWQPMGAQHSAYVTVDRGLLARGAGGICAHIDDLARFGQLILDGGMAGDTTVIPSDWIADTLSNGDRDAWVRGDFHDLLPNGCYRNKWYQIGDQDQSYMALGIHGQWLYVNPATAVVIAKLSSQPAPVDDDLDNTWLRVFAEISRAF